MEKYKDTTASAEERAQDLLSRMTVEEKVYQLSAQMLFDCDEQYKNERDYRNGHYRNPGHFMHRSRDVKHSEVAHAVNEDVRKSIEASRFGIPVLENGEALHGAQWGMATCFPQPIALASSFDTGMMDEVAEVIGKEVHAAGVRQVFAPVVNIARDCRWGRTMETYGEDVKLSSDFGVSMCSGLQKNGVIATPKHFVDNYSDGGRDSNYSDTSWRTLAEVYLEPFRRCFRDGGAMSVMAAYNGVDGIPCSCSSVLLDTILRRQWGFGGFVVSDYGGTESVCRVHKITDTQESGYAACLKAGLDVSLPNPGYETIMNALRTGKLTEDEIDKNVLRVLRAKFSIGLFDNPYVDEKSADEIVRCEAHRQIALRSARECMVLLKNAGILPLESSRIRRIGIFGEGADIVPIGQNYSGPYGGWRADDAETPLSYLKKYLDGKAEIVTAKDADISAAAKACDVCLYLTRVVEGEGQDRCNIRLTREHSEQDKAPDGGIIVDRVTGQTVSDQDGAIRTMCESNRNSVVVLLNGTPIDMTPWIDEAGAVLEAWYPGEQGAQAMAEVLFGECCPSGKLPITFPRSVGQLPLYYSHKTSGRGYGYNENDGSPLFAFGYGLSYTKFEISNVSPVLNDNRLSVELDITNTGAYDGAEVVQVYISGRNCGVMRPVMELKGYRRVELSKGETKHAAVSLDDEAFCFYDAAMSYGVHDCDYTVKAGTSSDNIISSFEIQVRDGKIINTL